MPGQRVSADPACWSFGSGLVINEPMIDGGRTPSEVGVPATLERKLDGTAEARALLPIGAVIQGTYRLDRVLGVGGMASVFAATHLRNANRVAVKILHPDLAKNSDVRARFLREGYAANSVRHAGTVRIFDDHIEKDGAVFFVMELLEGETLASLWERRGRRLPPGEVAPLMCQLLDILSAAHEKGIIHRDVKPENLFIECDGTLRVLDFGVARVLEGALTETRAGSVIGTLPYMAPEQILGKIHEIDARADIWSVGATAFALVSGRFVHEAETPEEMLVFTASRQARSLASVAPQSSRAFNQVVDRALRFDKSERWPSALAMQAAFAEACPSTRRAPEEPEAMVTVARASNTAPGTRFGPPWMRGIAAAFVIAGAVAALEANERRSPPAARATVLVQPPVPLPRFPVRTALRVADASGTKAPSLDERVVALVAPAAVGTSALERESGAVREAPEDIAAKPKRIADLGWGLPRPPEPTVNGRAPDACTPPFTIVVITGKKIWKRKCL